VAGCEQRGLRETPRAKLPLTQGVKMSQFATIRRSESLGILPKTVTATPEEIESQCPDSINSSYISEHGSVPLAAKEKCLRLARMIENSSSGDVPVAGDIIVCHGHNNSRAESVTYPNGHIERVGQDGANCCVEPYQPFVFEDGTMSTSGGYWLTAEVAQMKLTGTSIKSFWTWGRLPCKSGGVSFLATVHTWEYTNNDKIY